MSLFVFLYSYRISCRQNLYKKKPGTQTPEKDENGNFTYDETCEEAQSCIAEMNEYLEEKGVTESSEN